MTDPLRIAIVGATGYTGAELVRILLAHPHATLVAAVGRSNVDHALADALPSLRGAIDLPIEAFDAAALAQRADAVSAPFPTPRARPSWTS